MGPPDLIVEPVRAPEELLALQADADSDGRGMVSRLVREWREGRNRFDGPGEKVYLARRGSRVCAVGGLNRDPYAGGYAIGRVRRLYVAVDDRRKGIGSMIIDRLIADARGTYTSLHVRTYDAVAAAFYEAHGFERVIGKEEVTHRRPIV